MKSTTLLTLATLLLTSSASIVDEVQNVIGSVNTSLTPLAVAVQIPCCSAPPCPGCPAARGNLTSLTSISFPQTGLASLTNNPPGCGDGFSAEDCLRFFQVMLVTFEKPLGIAVGKIAEDKDVKGVEVKGCGTESSPGECLRYVRGFMGEVRGPLERTLGKGRVVEEDEEEVVVGEGEGEGKSEL